MAIVVLVAGGNIRVTFVEICNISSWQKHYGSISSALSLWEFQYPAPSLDLNLQGELNYWELEIQDILRRENNKIVIQKRGNGEIQSGFVQQIHYTVGSKYMLY